MAHHAFEMIPDIVFELMFVPKLEYVKSNDTSLLQDGLVHGPHHEYWAKTHSWTVLAHSHEAIVGWGEPL